MEQIVIIFYPQNRNLKRIISSLLLIIKGGENEYDWSNKCMDYLSNFDIWQRTTFVVYSKWPAGKVGHGNYNGRAIHDNSLSCVYDWWVLK